MRAQAAYRIIAATLRPPTPRKIYNRLKKLGVNDTYAEMHWFFGLDLTREQLAEFTQPATSTRPRQ